MKKILSLFLLTLLVGACGADNSSVVSFTLDENECLVSASGFDDVSRGVSDDGIRSEVYVWDCAEYVNEEEGIDVTEKRVTLVFEGQTCLELTATTVATGHCRQGKTPLL